MRFRKEFNNGVIVDEDARTGFIEIYVDPEVQSRNVFMEKAVEQQSLPCFEDHIVRLPQINWDTNPNVVEGYYKTWQIAFSNLRQPTAENGFVSNFIDTAFNNYLFMWDSAFITMFGKYANHCFPFIQTLDNLYVKQRPDGFISREISIENGNEHFHRHDPVSTGPNILPWAEWQHYELTGDLQRLREVFPPLLGLHRWIADNRTWKDGSYWGCGWSCGMDNQLRVEKEKQDYSHHSHSSWIDVTLQQYLSGTLLVKIHEEIQSGEDINSIKQELANLKSLINQKMWDPSRQFYFDTLRDDSFSTIKSIAAYWALLTDLVPEEHMADFVAHLDDESSFKRPHRVPAMAADCEHYADDGGYWRGGVWAPTNYMVLKGLECHGFHHLAFDIALNHVQHVAAIYGETGTVWENYSPELSRPGEPAKRDFVGWSGLSLISILIEFVFGIKMDVPNNQIVIRPYLDEAYSVRKLQFGTLGSVDIEVSSKVDASGLDRVVVKTALDINITVIDG
ncbi:MGH1-like glycoside hydrolase domain-containing protein [Vibrio mediterranei]|nr:trehalase family glycosidase [Vibrio mediterranei]MCG9659074.1 hypothetical protein [Vibrio mediterranei]